MKKSLLLDGYNVIYASAGLRQKMSQKPELARLALAQACRLYLARRRDLEKLWIVFDGQEQATDLPAGETGGVREIYTRAGETADKRMAQIVRNDEEPEQWIVISSDRGVFDRCRSLGAQSRKASDFVRELEPKQSSPVPEAKAISSKEAAKITEEYKKHLGLP